MKKSNFMALVLGTVSGVFFALGMCMALLPEWGLRTQGTVCGAVGLALGFVTLILWRRMEGKAPVRVSARLVGSVLLGVLGALLLGVGMCLSMVFGKMVLGIAVGIIGIVVLLMLIPAVKGLRG